jgi:hypothetical protein
VQPRFIVARANEPLINDKLASLLEATLRIEPIGLSKHHEVHQENHVHPTPPVLRRLVLPAVIEIAYQRAYQVVRSEARRRLRR